ncbi:hypothetical protein GEMRC1_013354 [Eukaryota sp. GEM-RC1]
MGKCQSIPTSSSSSVSITETATSMTETVRSCSKTSDLSFYSRRSSLVNDYSTDSDGRLSVTIPPTGECLKLRQYEILNCLAQSSFSSVYVANWLHTGKKVVLKAYSTSFTTSRLAQKNLLLEKANTHEVSVQQRLQHPNIVQFIDSFDDVYQCKRYIVLEYLEKGALAADTCTRLDPPLDVATARRYFKDIIDVLDYLHEQQIVHRDIKPSNLLLTDDGHVKLSDFGISIDLEADIESAATLTGSSAFLSPEIVSGYVDRATPASDIWAAGLTLYFLTFGTLPFYDNRVFNMYRNICHGELKFPHNVDPLLRHLLSSMLQKDPSIRLSANGLKHHPWVSSSNETSIVTDDEEILLLENELKEFNRKFPPKKSDLDLLQILPSVFTSETIDVGSSSSSGQVTPKPKQETKSSLDVMKIMCSDSSASEHDWLCETGSVTEGSDIEVVRDVVFS